MTGDAAWSEVARLFDLAAALEHTARAAFLDQSCRDPVVRGEVESLLAADAQAEGFLEPPLPALHREGARIGAYRLIRKLGEGETSSVHLAVRDDNQYHQHVAIKVMRPGMDSRQILQRFQQERQILASLNHPHIARLLDGGSTPGGQPYFVMEHVDGAPLDVHCQQHDLPLASRLELFCRICEAVQFAHRALVVHRDLKPANILVDAEGAPKLLDFGIAKLLDPDRIGIRIERTATVARLMTPHYASPEQVQGRPVSTASDIYSLGVILYKLITGRRPYELASQSLHEIERVVCEVTPPPPSRILCARRGDRLRDLDAIVVMAMRKEPERRYKSAQALADDVRRWFERRPVLARRATLGYRAGSFACRNAGSLAAAVVIVSLLGGAAAAVWQWTHAFRRAHAESVPRTTGGTSIHVIDPALDTLGGRDDDTALGSPEHCDDQVRGGSRRPDAHPPSCDQSDPLPQPVAHWSYDDPCESAAVTDSSGHGLNGIKLDGVGCAPGQHGGAGSFAGIDDAVVVPDRSILHFTTAMTAAAWVKPGRVAGSQTIINKWYAPDSYMLLLENGRYHFSVGLASGDHVTVSAPAVADQWSHVAGVFDGSTISLYIDGLLTSSVAAPGWLSDSDRAIVMGYFPTWNAYLGLIDDVYLYNVALDACQIAQLAR